MADDVLSARWAARKAAREAGLQEARQSVRQIIKDSQAERTVAAHELAARSLRTIADKTTPTILRRAAAYIEEKL